MDTPRRLRFAPSRALTVAVAMAMATPSECAAAAWTLSPTQQVAVERGEIVVVASRETGAGERSATSARAAIRIAAPLEVVFGIMTDCSLAATWVPHLVSCRSLQLGPGRTMEVIAHQIDYGWYTPRIDYVFRAHYVGGRQIRFEHVSGDLDENEGAWELEPAADGIATIVTYRVRTRPRFAVPQWLYQRGVTREVPGLLRALRARAER